MLAIAGATLFAVSGALHLQVPSVNPAPDAALGHPFSRIVSTAEMSDGRLLVVDMLERSVSLVDFAEDSRTELGREGRGPREFTSPYRIVRLRDDTLGVYDGANRRLFVIDGGGAVVGTRRLPEQLYGPGGRSQPKGGDAAGNLYFALSRPFTGVDDIPTRSKLVRLNLETGVIDSLQQVLTRDSLNRKMLNPFITADAWEVTRDGVLAIVRGGDFHVEWWDAAEPVFGQSVPHSRSSIDDDEVRAYMDSDRRRMAGAISISGDEDRTSSEDLRRIRNDWVFPETGPAFIRDNVHMDGDNRLYVQHSRAWDSRSTIIDVFDRESDRVLRLSIDEKLELVGVGERGLYLVATDSDGLQWLRRYRLPRN